MEARCPTCHGWPSLRGQESSEHEACDCESTQWLRGFVRVDEKTLARAGRLPLDRDPMAAIFATLESETLCPSLEECFAVRTVGDAYEGSVPEDLSGYRWTCSGNFLELSLSFDVFTSDESLAQRLASAVRKNVGTPVYRDAKRAMEASRRQRLAEEVAKTRVALRGAL